MDMQERSLKKALKLIGGPVALSRILDITPQAISQWKRAPVRHVLKIERATDEEVTRHQLRPDIYGRA